MLREELDLARGEPHNWFQYQAVTLEITYILISLKELRMVHLYICR